MSVNLHYIATVYTEHCVHWTCFIQPKKRKAHIHTHTRTYIQGAWHTICQWLCKAYAHSRTWMKLILTNKQGAHNYMHIHYCISRTSAYPHWHQSGVKLLVNSTYLTKWDYNEWLWLSINKIHTSSRGWNHPRLRDIQDIFWVKEIIRVLLNI